MCVFKRMTFILCQKNQTNKEKGQAFKRKFRSPDVNIYLVGRELVTGGSWAQWHLKQMQYFQNYVFSISLITLMVLRGEINCCWRVTVCLSRVLYLDSLSPNFCLYVYIYIHIIDVQKKSMSTL